jgi:tRNA pseudouridine13 synthase
LVERGRALVAGPLVGYRTPSDSGVPGELLDTILREEGVERAMFETPRAPDVASKGAWRAILVPTPPIAISSEATSVRFRFALPKGAYATVLLREFQKTGATPGPS